MCETILDEGGQLPMQRNAVRSHSDGLQAVFAQRFQTTCSDIASIQSDVPGWRQPHGTSDWELRTNNLNNAFPHRRLPASESDFGYPTLHKQGSEADNLIVRENVVRR